MPEVGRDVFKPAGFSTRPFLSRIWWGTKAYTAAACAPFATPDLSLRKELSGVRASNCGGHWKGSSRRYNASSSRSYPNDSTKWVCPSSRVNERLDV